MRLYPYLCCFLLLPHSLRAQSTVVVDDYPSTGCTVGSTTYTNQLSCAFYTAVSMATTTSGVELVLGSNHYNTEVPLIEPSPSVSNQPMIDIVGINHSTSWIVASANMGTSAVLVFPDATNGYTYGVTHLEGFTIEPNGNAIAAAQYFALNKATITDVYYKSDVVPGSTTVVQVGNMDVNSASQPIGGTYELHISKSSIDSYNYVTQAYSTVTVTGGVPSVSSLTNPGAGYNANVSGYATGTGAGGEPCTTMGTISVTQTAGAVNPPAFTGFSGCVAPMWVNFDSTSNVQYGWEFVNMTDSAVDDIVISAGKSCQFYVTQHTSNNYFTGVHPDGGSLECGIKDDAGGNVYLSPELDTVGHYGMMFSTTGSKGTTVVGARHYWNTANEIGSEDYYIPSTTIANVNIVGDICLNNNSAANGYHQVVTSTGPIPFYSGETGAATVPQFLSMTDTMSCDGSEQVRTVSSNNLQLGGRGGTQQLYMGLSGSPAPRAYIAFDNTGVAPAILGSGSGHPLMFKTNVSPFTASFTGGFDTSGNFGVGNNTTITSDPWSVSGVTGQVFQALCSSTASPAACGSATAGKVQVAAAVTSLTINSSSFTANSGCWFSYDVSGATAPTNIAQLLPPYISARTPGTSITVTVPVAPVTNPVGLQFGCVN